MAIEIEKFIDLTKNDLWTSADIDNRARSLLAGVVSSARQDELRTIMIGHMAQMRSATPAELQEVIKVKNYSEAIGLQIIQARLDNELLRKTLNHEQALKTLALPDTEDNAQAKADAQALVNSATQDVLDLVELRKPLVEEVVIVDQNPPPFFNTPEPTPEPVVVDPPAENPPVDPPADPAP